jgi:hypothetical protein
MREWTWIQHDSVLQPILTHDPDGGGRNAPRRRNTHVTRKWRRTFTSPARVTAFTAFYGHGVAKRMSRDF